MSCAIEGRPRYEPSRRRRSTGSSRRSRQRQTKTCSLSTGSLGSRSARSRRPWSGTRPGTTRSTCLTSRRRAISPGRADLPEGVLLHDLTVAERPEVAPADLDPLARGRRAGERPLGGAAIAVDEVVVVPIADIGDAGEPGGERLPYGVAALEPGAPRLGAPRALEHGVVREVGHDHVEVVLVECRGDRLEHPHRLVVVHLPPPAVASS